MQLGKVIGSVVATQKTENIKGLRLMVVRYLDENLKPKAKTTVSIDTVSTRKGDIVLLCSSSSARMTSLTRYACTDNTIVGIVETISFKNENLYNKSGPPFGS
jgi:ethanolamine utilization protein EutN